MLDKQNSLKKIGLM